MKHAENDAAKSAWRSEDGKSHLHLGDAIAFMQGLPPDSVDCIWTDPPYLLSNDGITCVATHLGVPAAARECDARELIRSLEGISPVVIGGDMNDRPGGPATRLLATPLLSRDPSSKSTLPSSGSALLLEAEFDF